LALATPLGTEVRDLDRLAEAWLMVICGRDAEAESVLQELTQRPEQRAAALEALAGRELETRRNDAAGRHYTELGKAGDRAGAQFGLAIIAERSGDNERAASLYSAITTGRHAVEAQMRAYRLHVSTDGADIADRVLDEFVYANPDLRRDLSSMRMLTLAELNQTDSALALGARVMRAFPDAEELVRAQSEVLARAGRPREAVALLEALLKRRPDDPAAQNALGYTLADARLDLPRAQKLLQAACAQAPDNPAYLDSLGWLRYRQGQFAPARELLDRAYRLQPDAEIAVHLAQAVAATGLSEEAQRVIDSALIRYPQDAGLLRWANEHQRGKP
jgi:predicted Zn-dependent protease